MPFVVAPGLLPSDYRCLTSARTYYKSTSFGSVLQSRVHTPQHYKTLDLATYRGLGSNAASSHHPAPYLKFALAYNYRRNLLHFAAPDSVDHYYSKPPEDRIGVGGICFRSDKAAWGHSCSLPACLCMIASVLLFTLCSLIRIRFPPRVFTSTRRAKVADVGVQNKHLVCNCEHSTTFNLLHFKSRSNWALQYRRPSSLSPPPVPKFHPRYNTNGGDLVLRPSANPAVLAVSFRHTSLLRLASPAFKVMLSIPRSKQETAEDPVDMDEDAQVLETLLDLIYPQSDLPTFSSLAHVQSVFLAAKKFDMARVLEIARRIVLSDLSLEADPVGLYLLARICQEPTLASFASKLTLRAHLTEDDLSRLAMLPGSDVLALVNLHIARKTHILSVFDWTKDIVQKEDLSHFRWFCWNHDHHDCENAEPIGDRNMHFLLELETKHLRLWVRAH